jgi:hypothetical protein
MSSVDQGLRSFADLFCVLYDRLDLDTVRDHAADWLVNPVLESLSATFTSDVENGRALAQVGTRLNSVSTGEDSNRRILPRSAGSTAPSVTFIP